MGKKKKLEDCPDCDVAPGEQHDGDCDVARCVLCGKQSISCDHDGSLPDVWTGEWPGKAECREFGLWCIRKRRVRRWGDRIGYVVVPVTTPGASEDLNRLREPEFEWSRDLQKWVRSEKKRRVE